MGKSIPKSNAKHSGPLRVYEYKDGDKLNTSQRSQKRRKSSKEKVEGADSHNDNERDLSEEIKKEFEDYKEKEKNDVIISFFP